MKGSPVDELNELSDTTRQFPQLCWQQPLRFVVLLNSVSKTEMIENAQDLHDPCPRLHIEDNTSVPLTQWQKKHERQQLRAIYKPRPTRSKLWRKHCFLH